MNQTPLSEKKIWEDMYHKRVDPRYWPCPNERCSAFELDEVFRRYLPYRDGTKILEMGCGGSRWLPYFAKVFNYDIYGVDYSELGCQSALENLERVGKTGKIYNEDFENLNSGLKKSFDVLLSFGVVEHFERPEEILRQFGECLSDNGLIVTYVPNFWGIMGRFLKRLDKSLYDTHNIFCIEDLVRYHQEAGMRPLFSSYLEFTDFSILPLDRLPKPVMLIAKNLIHIANRARLFCYQSFPIRPQSAFLCAAMIVIAQKKPV